MRWTKTRHSTPTCAHKVHRGLIVTAVLLVAGLVVLPASATAPGVNGELFFTRDLDGNGATVPAIYATTAGGAERLVVADGEGGFSPKVSPDGSQILYIRNGALLRRPAGGGDDTMILPTDSVLFHAAWSPDGTQIIYFDADDGWSVINTDGSGQRALNLSSSAGLHDIEWSVDGFAYQAMEDTIYRIDPATGAVTEIPAPDMRILEDQDLDTSPDGTSLAVACFQLSDPESARSVCVVGTDGTLRQRIAPANLFPTDPLFSPDGSRIAFASATPPNFDTTNTYSTDLAGGDLQQILTDGIASSWSPVDGVPQPPPPPAPAPECVDLDDDATTTERIAETEPVRVAVALSCGVWPDADGPGGADHVVLSRDDAFADSLAGAALTARGPMLFSGSQSLDPLTSAEIQRVLSPGGTVYLLGGEAALSAGIETEIGQLGFAAERLSGPSRVETALAVADEVARLAPPDFVMIARAFNAPGNETSGWADSVTGGAFAAATNQPIIITSSDSVHPAVAEWLAQRDGLSIILLGGEAALSAAVADAVGPHERIAGNNRFATNAAIVDALADFDGVPQTEGFRRYTMINGEDPLGWAHGLAAASRAQLQRAPVIMTGNGSTVRDSLAPLVSACGDPEVEILLIGTDDVIDPSIVSALDGLDGTGCPS